MSQGIEVAGADPEETNSEELIELRLVFDPQKHSLMFSFDNQKLRSWDFALALLEMARVQAEFQRTTRLNQKMAEASMAQMQEQMIKQQLAMSGRNGA